MQKYKVKENINHTRVCLHRLTLKCVRHQKPVCFVATNQFFKKGLGILAATLPHHHATTISLLLLMTLK